LGQIDLVIQERSLRKLSWLSNTQARKTCVSGIVIHLRRHLQTPAEQKLKDHWAAVRLQLQHILASE
jgi:hypothetical protein